MFDDYYLSMDVKGLVITAINNLGVKYPVIAEHFGIKYETTKTLSKRFKKTYSFSDDSLACLYTLDALIKHLQDVRKGLQGMIDLRGKLDLQEVQDEPVKGDSTVQVEPEIPQKKLTAHVYESVQPEPVASIGSGMKEVQSEPKFLSARNDLLENLSLLKSAKLIRVSKLLTGKIITIEDPRKKGKTKIPNQSRMIQEIIKYVGNDRGKVQALEIAIERA